MNDVCNLLDGKSSLSGEDSASFYSKTCSSSANSPQDFKDLVKKELMSRDCAKVKCLLESLRSMDLEAYGSQISAHTVLLRGSNDQFVQEEEAKSVEKLIPNSTYTLVKGSGHTVLWDQLNAVSNIYLETGASAASK